MTKAQRIAEYNRANKSYCITNIKKLSKENIQSSKKFGSNSLHECYANPSQAKISSYNDILSTYEPKEIISVQGSSHSYSVLLQASNGDILHITKANNYLVDIKE